MRDLPILLRELFLAVGENFTTAFIIDTEGSGSGESNDSRGFH